MNEQDIQVFMDQAERLIETLGSLEAVGLAIKEAGSDMAGGSGAIVNSIDHLTEAVERLAGAVAGLEER